MTSASNCILSLNVGSSSIRFAVHEANVGLERRLDGTLDRIGARDATLTTKDHAASRPVARIVVAPEHDAAGRVLLDWFEAQSMLPAVAAAGHRVVHGMHGGVDTLVFAGGIGELNELDRFHLVSDVADRLLGGSAGDPGLEMEPRRVGGRGSAAAPKAGELSWPWDTPPIH